MHRNLPTSGRLRLLYSAFKLFCGVPCFQPVVILSHIARTRALLKYWSHRGHHRDRHHFLPMIAWKWVKPSIDRRSYFKLAGSGIWPGHILLKSWFYSQSLLGRENNSYATQRRCSLKEFYLLDEFLLEPMKYANFVMHGMSLNIPKQIQIEFVPVCIKLRHNSEAYFRTVWKEMMSLDYLNKTLRLSTSLYDHCVQFATNFSISYDSSVEEKRKRGRSHEATAVGHVRAAIIKHIFLNFAALSALQYSAR